MGGAGRLLRVSFSVTTTFYPWSTNREKVCSPSLRGGKLLSSYLLLSLSCHLYRKYCHMFLSLRASLWDVRCNKQTNKQTKETMFITCWFLNLSTLCPVNHLAHVMYMAVLFLQFFAFSKNRLALGIFLKNSENQRTGWIWVFLRNSENQRTGWIWVFF
jgi:hypothetical protein